MKLNLTLLLVSFFLSFGWYEIKTLHDNDRLINAVTSKKFTDFFQLCKMENDTVKIFHNFDNFSLHQFVKLECGKILEIEKKVVQVDVNSTSLNRPIYMVLHKFEKRKQKYEFRFLDVRSNGNLILVFNKKNKLVNYGGGSF